MIDFKTVELSDKEWMDPLIAASDFSGCHHNFGNIFAWSKINKTRIGRVNDFLVVKGGEEEHLQDYFYPTGKGDIKSALLELKKDAQERGHKFSLIGVSPENIKELDSLFPGMFKYEANVDSFDYVYTLEKLSTLSGKKLHSKRNHINNFKKNNDNWSFEIINTNNIDECREMNKEWCIEAGCYEDDELKKEACVVKRFFDNFEPLGLDGGLIRLKGKVIAFTLGERLNSNTYVTHVEKAFKDIQGAYPLINNEFAIFLREKYPDLVYVNREEDVGEEGLRKAKQSYYPDKMEEKYTATFIGE